jgi:2-oxoglutarate ferredoxin oxidoreductase subunit gamma
MHDKFWPPVARKLRDGALVLVNDATFETEIDRTRYRVLRVPATRMADDLGNPLGGSMVMAGAFAATSGLVAMDSLLEGMRASVPPYRTQHIAANETALRAGYEWGGEHP